MNLRRKRMMLMDGQWYGYLRTATGNPLTLQNAKRLRQLTIYGNAVQDGTPSPDAPVEVQLCGDRTGNLLSIIDANPNTIPVKSYSNGIIEVIGEASLSGGRTNRLSDYITLETNQTYTMVSYLVAGQTDPDIYVCLSRREGGTIYESIEISAEKRFITIAPDENVELYLGIGVTQGNRNSTLRVAIYKGSYTADTLPAYEPYGYKVSGRTEGLNLLDTNDILNDRGYVNSSYDNAIEIKPFHVVEGNKYVLITKGEKLVNDYSTIYFGKDDLDYFDNRTIVLSTGILKYSFADNTEVRYVITSSETCEITRCMIHGKDNYKNAYTVEEFGLYEYTDDYRSMPYEPYQPPQDFAVYLPEQIAKVGDVADEVVVDMEKQTAELVRRIERNEFKGTDGWRNDWFPTIVKSLTPHGVANSRCISNYFDYNGGTSVPSVVITNAVGTTIGINRANLISEVTDTDTFKAWLSDKNVYAYYPLATPVTTDITSLQQWDAMPQVSGTVTLTLSAEVDPSGAEAVYYSKERGE